MRAYKRREEGAKGLSSPGLYPAMDFLRARGRCCSRRVYIAGYGLCLGGPVTEGAFIFNFSAFDFELNEKNWREREREWEGMRSYTEVL